MKTESVVTVVVAALMNLGIAVAKLVAGVLSGSAAMVSEAAHSAADTVTEGMLYAALRSSARPADEAHPSDTGTPPTCGRPWPRPAPSSAAACSPSPTASTRSNPAARPTTWSPTSCSRSPS
ncbi:hypothetical protein GCM10029992_67280 [Glycomyces albus]